MKRGPALGAALLLVAAIACGKKGPPLPPLVRLPAAPKDFAAERQGPAVTVQFAIPTANTDGSTPAEITHVDVYALSGLSTITPDEILKRGVRVGRVEVNPPKDPDEPEEDAPKKKRKPSEPKPPDGHDQGETIRVTEALSPDVLAIASDDVRSYLAVGFNKRGRRGAISSRALVPLVPAPLAPGAPEIVYDETSITVTWPPPEDAEMPAYHVYDAGDPVARLTTQPVTEPRFVDKRMDWGKSRCYIVRTVTAAEGLRLEGDASPRACAMLVDTFPPKSPAGLQAIASEGAVDLIWDSNSEADLAGYMVLRAVAPDTTLKPVTPAPIAQPTFTDKVATGAHVTYAVVAVDRAGNSSPMSDTITETAR